MKRWDTDWTRDAAMEECADGGYVTYSDALELQRQLEAITKERDQLRAALDLADALRNRERATNKDFLDARAASYQSQFDTRADARRELGFKEQK